MNPTLDAFRETSPLRVEVAAPYAILSWDRELRQRSNFADENLSLRVMNPDGSTRAEFEVNHLSSRQLHLPAGKFRAELVRVARPQVSVTSSLEPTPPVTWLQDSPGSHVVVWGELDWDRVSRDLQQVHGLAWDQARVSLAVDWTEDGETRRSWIDVPERDHCTLRGRVERIELAVLQQGSDELLKSLFYARRDPGAPLQVVAALEFEVPDAPQGLFLTREIWEEDSLQLRVHWSLEHSGAPLELVLTCNGEELEPGVTREVAAEGDWLFHDLPGGIYQARLQTRPQGKKKAAVVHESRPYELSAHGNRCVLIPVKEDVAFGYWHVDLSTWKKLAAEHGDLLGRVRCFVQVFQEYGGDWWLKPELSPEVDVAATRDFYFNLPPDRLYRLQVVAVVDGAHTVALTEPSNRVQLGRMVAGSNPVHHKWHPQNSEHPSIRPLRNPRGTSEHSIGYMLLHLHAHLPFMPDPIGFREGEMWRPAGYPQEWYAEAVRETYLPLLELFESLSAEGVDFKLSMDISPPLVAMMKSQRHSADVLEYLERLIVLARLEVERTAREEPHYHTPARMHLRHLVRSRDLFLSYGGDLTVGFKRFQDLGYLELCTCIGTHPMLPQWMSVPSAIRGHAQAAAPYHEEVFGRPSLGVWLPECSYTPGIEPYLEEAGFRYFFTDSITVLRGDTPAEFGVNAPVYLKGSSLTAFPRDPETSEQVWSGEQGYPGDADYLEFHIRGGAFKYNRITSRTSDYKQPYNPDWAERKAASHAGHFVFCRNARFEYLRKVMWKKPVVIAPYDAELFGHHWYEGPRFLYFLFKKLHYDQNSTELITPIHYLAANPTGQDMYLSTSSWGEKGTFEKWMRPDTSWMYRHVHEAAAAYGELTAREWPQGDGLTQRLLKQAGRMLMLASSSDLPFVINNGHFVDRMKGQFLNALRDFWILRDELLASDAGGPASPQALALLRRLEIEVTLFPNLDPSVFKNPSAG